MEPEGNYYFIGLCDRGPFLEALRTARFELVDIGFEERDWGESTITMGKQNAGMLINRPNGSLGVTSLTRFKEGQELDKLLRQYQT